MMEADFSCLAELPKELKAGVVDGQHHYAVERQVSLRDFVCLLLEMHALLCRKKQRLVCTTQSLAYGCVLLLCSCSAFHCRYHVGMQFFITKPHWHSFQSAL